MWHIMLCGLLALPLSNELDQRKKSEVALLTEQNSESCATCAKCAKKSELRDENTGNCATEMREISATHNVVARRSCANRRWLARKPHIALGWRR